MDESYYPPRLSSFFVLLLSATIFLSSIIFLFYNPVPPKTLNSSPVWNTYTNNLLGYSIQYPPHLEIHSSYPSGFYDDGTKVDLSQTPNIFLFSDQTYIAFKQESMIHNAKTFADSANHWRQYYMSSTAELGNTKAEVVKEEKFEIAGVEGIKNTISYQFENTLKPRTAVWIYVPISSENLLSIKYELDGSNPKEHEIYDHILSTFRFIDPSEASVKEDEFSK